MSSRRQVVLEREGTSLEEDIDAPKEKVSSTEATAFAASDKEDITKPFGIITLLKDIIVGIILGVILISTSIYLDYHDVIHSRGAHNVRNATLQLLDNSETIANLEESFELKFMKMNEYESNRKEIDSVAEKLAFRNEDLEKRTAEAEGKHKEAESIRPEHESLMLMANTQFELDKYCGECMWVGKTTCNQRVQFLKRTYSTGRANAKIDAMKLPTCTMQ
mmetsp:Transcript_23273/g.37983  ORF Transcript_23273/g.37983 Transcript_23273/m.37983 type:complete len:220 (+) Transcript_23273:58-717(+)